MPELTKVASLFINDSYATFMPDHGGLTLKEIRHKLLSSRLNDDEIYTLFTTSNLIIDVGFVMTYELVIW